MKLRAYLKAKGLAAVLQGGERTQLARAVRDFALLIEVKPLAVYRYISGTRVPEPAVMARIVTVTGGEVTPNDFYDLPPLTNEVAA